VSSSSSHPHARLIQQAAKEILAPLGVFQRGRSRLWIDDHGGWLTLIEFQPSSWSKGSYLNVAAMWLWNERDYFSFDVGHRARGFVAYENEAQFQPEIARQAIAARERVLEFRKQFPSIDGIAQFLKKNAKERNPHQLLDAAIALVYVGKVKDSRAVFAKIFSQKPTYDWEKDVQNRARQLEELLNDPAAFRKRIEQAVLTTRKLLKLPERADVRIS